jgi:hypothetical protein
MNIAQAKQIPIEDVLARLGHLPHRRIRDQLWYFSPLREETKPSFKVNQSANLWYDFGEQSSGDVIDLVMRLDRLGTVSETLARIAEIVGMAMPPAPKHSAAEKCQITPVIEITHIGPMKTHSLIEYLKQRGIDPKLAAPFVREVHYRRGAESYFALAFASDSGGIELRNPYFKGTLGAKDITFLQGNPKRVMVFEGFFDFLTAVTLCGGRPDATVIVLNSAAMRNKAAERIGELKPDVVELYRHRDPTGEELLAFFQTLPDTAIIDQSCLYAGHKDLNEWHANRKPPDAMKRSHHCR